jgi:Zn-dependent M28 family amino/carboxypeptidase
LSTPKRSLALVAGILLATLALLVPPSAATGTGRQHHSRPAGSAGLVRAVDVDGVLDHLDALQAIADENDGTRASGTPGFEASVDYVVRKLRRAGYRPQVQEFTFPFFQQLAPSTFEQTSPTPTTYVEGTDYFTADFSGAGDVTGTLQAVDLTLPPTPEPSSTSGCEPEDFAGFTAGNIALVQRGSCDFAVKVANAETAGAVGVVIFNEGQEGRTDAFQGTLGGPVDVPVVMPSFAIGSALNDAGDATVHLATTTLSEDRQTWNVLADTRGGRADRTVVVGAHLDSVVAGPGINDNGSGTATILEVAEQLARLDRGGHHGRNRGHGHGHGGLANRVRFAWWGAEESGLLGSTHYVESLTDEQRSKIALNLNFDMLGSPNAVRFVYDGDGSDTDTAGPAGSDRIEASFLRWFERNDLATAPTAFDGRSDYGPFIDVGIPAGGLFSGAEGVKTDDEAAAFGGTAGEPYDPCYHQACDTTENIDPTVLDQMADAVAHATWLWSHRHLPARTTTESAEAGRFASTGTGPLVTA